jgi:hypothetical protein
MIDSVAYFKSGSADIFMSIYMGLGSYRMEIPRILMIDK